MDEPEIEIEQVKVEEVILNKSGKRAIRLDAWAKTKDQRIFDMEMQNEGHQDSMPKRSRYYQGMLDRPLLRSGNVPDTGICHLQRLFLLRRKIFFKRI